MYCHQYFFGDKYDLIQLHRQIEGQNDGISMRNSLKSWVPKIITNSIFYLEIKGNKKMTWNLF